MKWTDEQLAAIEFPKRDNIKLPADMRSATVTAAAGSGKTALLVERVIRILCDTENPIPADKIAIMTFTRNAAEEFRRRMTDAVAAAARKDPRNTYLSEQLIKFRSAPISTISSFCLSVIRENTEKFGLPVGFSIIDEAKAALLKANAIDMTMEYFYSDKFDPDSRDLLFKTFSFRDDKTLTETIGSLYNKISSLTDPYDWLDGCADAYSSPAKAEKRFIPYYLDTINRLLERTKNSFNSFSAIIDMLPDDHPDIKKLLSMREDDRGRLDDAIKKFAALGNSPTLAQLYGFSSTIGLNAKGALRFAALSCKDEFIKNKIELPRNKFKDDFKEIIAVVPDETMMISELEKQHDAVSSLITLIKLYGDEYTKQKREAGYVDFSDCEQLLLDMLRKDEEFRNQVSQRYRCIIVDEFQDTNDIQYEIFKLISNKENNLFFVGDIKQSIYAFRGGNPRIMLELCEPTITQKLYVFPHADSLRRIRKRNKLTRPALPRTRTLKSGCKVFSLGAKHTPLPLNKNFRSRQSVIDTVNAMFTGLMTKKYGDVDYNDSTKLVCGASYPEATADYTSELHLLNYYDEPEKEVAEARYTASLINNMMKNVFPVKNGENSTRPCTYGDFCILLRASTHADIFKNELESFNIPVNSGGSKSYLASEEISLILNYLKVIDNPLKDEELLKILMSPIYMMSADDLGKARLGILGIDKEKAQGTDLTPLYERYKNASLFACISACARAADSSVFGAFTEDFSEGELEKLRSLRTEGHPKCVRFLTHLTEFRAFRANNSIERLIRKIYDDTDFFSVISTYERGEQKLANIRLLLKYAADFENNGGGTLGDFLRYTDHVRDSSESFAEAVTAESAENSVKIMTFHASKGLEMPIVILAELGKNPNHKDTSGAMVFNRSAGIGLRYVDINIRYQYKPFGYTAITMAEEQKQKGEELRLLYVAMTRAREKLIMIGKCKEKDIETIRTYNFTADFAMSESSALDWILASMLRYSDGTILTDGEEKVFGDNILKAKYVSEVPAAPDEADFIEPVQFSLLHDEEQASRIAKAISAEYSNSSLTSARSKFTVTEIAHMIDSKLGEAELSDGGTVFMSRPSFVPRGTLSGKEIGDAYHHIMEHFPIHEIFAGQEPTEEYSREVLEGLLTRGVLSEDELKHINPRHISEFFRSGLGKRMLKSKRIEREYPIFAELPARDIYVEQDGDTIIQGRADMFFYEDDGIVLVDYKSDSKENLQKELEAYSRQLSIYRTILPIMTGVKVKEIYIYSFSCDTAVSV
ncbi:MAG: UvrD-helicase domain-containing protein [Oscillospiraceae bacterium]|nr:UvrD-helicase domain-containing protein [Oscillospiraceae bacterium]